MSTKNKTSKKSNGNKLKSTIKKSKKIHVKGFQPEPSLASIGKLPKLNPLAGAKKQHPLQFNCSYMKEDRVQRNELISLYPSIQQRISSWFKMFIGQLIYAISENEFVGLIEVMNEEHTHKLEMMQFKGYRFTSVLGIGEKLAEANNKARNDESKADVILFDNYKREITSERERISQAIKDNIRNSGMMDDIERMLGELFMSLFGLECDEEIENYKRAIVQVLAHIANTTHHKTNVLTGDSGSELHKLHEFFANLQIYSKEMDAYLAYWNIHFHGSISDENFSIIAKSYGVQ